jgi:hypothetical protein
MTKYNYPGLEALLERFAALCEDKGLAPEYQDTARDYFRSLDSKFQDPHARGLYEKWYSKATRRALTQALHKEEIDHATAYQMETAMDFMGQYEMVTAFPVVRKPLEENSQYLMLPNSQLVRLFGHWEK